MPKFTLTNGDDRFFATNGQDTVIGLAGDDEIHGRAGNDTLTGGEGDDALFGDDGNDVLYGSVGDDALYGGRGNDRLSGYFGDDDYYGGVGRDQFGFYLSGVSDTGHDTIHDWQKGQDKIRIGGESASWSDLDTNGNGRLDNGDSDVTVSGGTTTVDAGHAVFGGGWIGREVLTVEGDTALRQGDFLFA